jgi:hypothetical protein
MLHRITRCLGEIMPLSFQDISQLRRIVKAAERALQVANQLIETAPRVKRGRVAGTGKKQPASSLRPRKVRSTKASAVVREKSGKRVRRTGAALAEFRNAIRAGRRKGVPVAELAAEFGVTQAYIYQIK